MPRRHIPALVLLAGIAWPAATALAQPIGTFRWQQQPYCNVLSLYVTQHGGQYALHGTDDQCGAGQAAGVVGLAFLNPNGSIGFGLSIVTTPGARPVHVDATINLASLNGTWGDSAGNAGTFIFTPGPGIGGAPRPIPSGGIAPGSITAVQLASNSVTTTNVADASITNADLLDGPRVAFASGDQLIVLTSADTVVRSVSITAPSAGRVLVNASGYFRLTAAGADDIARCSITTGIVIDGTHLIIVDEATAVDLFLQPFAATRGFNVTAGSSTTFNLVCDEGAGDVEVADTSITALFVAGS